MKSTPFTEPCNLHSKTRGWWQCGLWVKDRRDATTYPNPKEAGDVKSLRGLPADTEVVLR
jgi:hypothetical protein